MTQQTYLPVKIQFYILVMFLGLPDDIHEEKPSFLDFDRLTDRLSCRDVKTRLKITGYNPTNGRTDWHTLICI